MIHNEDASYLIRWARELGTENPFFDFHVHPFDVLSGDMDYQADGNIDGLFRKGSAVYRAPVVVQMPAVPKEPAAPVQRPGWNSPQAFLLAARMAYAFIGRRVFADHLDAVGLSGALLLPVARRTGVAEKMLPANLKMFGDDARLVLGCSFPVGLLPDQLLAYYEAARNEWGVNVIKVHPNLMGLDALTQAGRELMEATFVAAGQLGLPIVIHGGRTPGLEPVEMREYGTFARLQDLHWELSSAPIVLAHCGCYGLAESELPPAISTLNRLLDRYPNLMADTSNLEMPALQMVLEKVDHGRLIFGSDALYIPVWKSWLQFLQTLQQISHQPEDDLIRIASLNAQCCLGRIQPRALEVCPTVQKSFDEMETKLCES